jgi:hypothetical protein
VFLQQTTPQGLKRATAPIHGIKLGKVGMWAAVVTPLNPMGRDTGIVLPAWFPFWHAEKAL